MKLATTEQRKPTRVSLFNMAYGQVGIDDDGEVYYRTINTVACLTNYKMTYSNILSCDKDSPICTHEVTLYPPGTKLTFVVDI